MPSTSALHCTGGTARRAVCREAERRRDSHRRQRRNLTVWPRRSLSHLSRGPAAEFDACMCCAGVGRVGAATTDVVGLHSHI